MVLVLCSSVHERRFSSIWAWFSHKFFERGRHSFYDVESPVAYKYIKKKKKNTPGLGQDIC